MIGEMIQEYLVGLGAKVDKPGFSEADRTIKALDRGVETATGHMADNFVKASAAITTALAGVTASIVGVMKAAAGQDLAMEKLSRQMMVSKQDAYAMKQATDALGESIQDITLTPELMDRFEKLAADGKKMQVGGDFEETMKGFRDLVFEFTRLKQEVSYAMTWVGYYLMKYLNKPLSEARDKFRSFNDSFVRNMSVWTEKAARAIVYIINIGRHLVDFAVDATKHLMVMWESFPKGVKIAVGALTALWLVMKASPLGRMIMLVGTLLMLIDDYYGYMEGKQAQFGKYWDKLNEYISIAKEKWEDFKSFAMPFWDRFTDFLSTAKDKVVEFAHGISEFLERAKNSSELHEFLDTIKDLGKTIWDFATVYVDGLMDALGNIRDGFSRTSESSGGLRGAIYRLWRIFLSLLKVVTNIIDFLARLMQEVQWTEEWQEFTGAVGELLGAFVELFNVILDLVKVAFGGLFGEIGKTDEVYSFRDAIRAVLKIFTLLIKSVTWTIKLFSKLFKMMKDSRPFRTFWETLGHVIDKAIEKIGKFGRALISLVKGDFKEAAAIVMGGDGPSGSNAGVGDNEWNAKVVYKRFKDAGYSDDAIAGIMGRVQQEHNFDTSDVPEHDVPGVGHVGGYGMFQWNGDRTTSFLEWAQSQGLDPQDPGVQSDYAIWEARERGLGPDRMNGMSTSEAATVWTDEWEVGKHGDEQTYAADWQDRINNGWGNDAAVEVGAKSTPQSSQAVNDNATDFGRRGVYDTGGVDITGSVNDGLLDKFNEFVNAIQGNGYDVYVQSGSENSIGFSSPAEDWWNIRDVAESYGLDVMHTDDGFYVSDPSYNSSGIMPTSFRRKSGNYGIDPLMYRGMAAGMAGMGIPMPVVGGGFGGGMGGSTVYNVNVGGVTVQGGANASAEDIGKAVGNETMKRLEERGQYILHSRTMAGAPVLV